MVAKPTPTSGKFRLGSRGAARIGMQTAPFFVDGMAADGVAGVPWVEHGSTRQRAEPMAAKTRLELGALSALAAMACGAPAVSGQTIVADSGARSIIVALSYTGELVQNAGGGARRGATVPGAAGVELTLRLGRLVGWHGARIFVFALGTHGGAPSDLVGDVQGVSNLEAPAEVRMEEAWLQQNLLGNRLSLLAGRYDLNTEFYRLQSGALFINSSFGIGPELAQSGAGGPSIFPNTAVGTRVDFKPSPNVVWRAAILDGVPVDRPGNGSRLFAPGDGALLIGEVALLARPDTAGMPRQRRFRIGRGLARPYSGKLALGAWYYTARFPDLVATLPDGAPVRHRGSGGAYLIGDQTVWSRGRGRPGALTAFAQLGLGDGRVNQIGGYLGGGLTFTAPFPSRAQDELGLAVAAARNGSSYERAQAVAGTPAAGETTVELTYLAQLGSWLAVQPDVQYVIHPGGTRAARNAVVLGLRIAVSH
jgi:porin